MHDYGEIGFAVRGQVTQEAAREAAKRYIRTNYPSLMGNYSDLQVRKSPLSGAWSVKVRYRRTVNGKDGE